MFAYDMPNFTPNPVPLPHILFVLPDSELSNGDVAPSLLCFTMTRFPTSELRKGCRFFGSLAILAQFEITLAFA